MSLGADRYWRGIATSRMSIFCKVIIFPYICTHKPISFVNDTTIIQRLWGLDTQQVPVSCAKISIDAGFACPNRDGHVGIGGCTFCDNRTFNPSYCQPSKSIAEQISEGKAFFARKYTGMKYLAYFQAYSNTYASVETLKRRYEEALSQEDVVGIIIGTRPDCAGSEVMDYLEQLNRQTFMIVEYGIESVSDKTLLRVNRGHDFECSRHALVETHNRGILTCGHIILGLPGESAEENIRQSEVVSNLKLDILKLHQLQIIKGTQLAEEYCREPFKLYSADEYIDLCIRYLERLRNDIIVERFVSQSPADMLIAPKWGLKNYEFTNRLVNEMKRRGTWQGRLL